MTTWLTVGTGAGAGDDWRVSPAIAAPAVRTVAASAAASANSCRRLAVRNSLPRAGDVAADARPTPPFFTLRF